MPTTDLGVKVGKEWAWGDPVHCALTKGYNARVFVLPLHCAHARSPGHKAAAPVNSLPSHAMPPFLGQASADSSEVGAPTTVDASAVALVALYVLAGCPVPRTTQVLAPSWHALPGLSQCPQAGVCSPFGRSPLLCSFT